MRIGFSWVAAAIATMMAQLAMAQMPGSPALQNAFVNPGITAAVDAAGLGGATTYAAAAAWAPGSARFQFSGGIGAQLRTGASTRTAYGARLNIPVIGATSSFGVSIFAGYGAISGGGAMDSTVAKALIPVGATASFRHAIGASRGVSLYGSPIFESVARGGGGAKTSVFRGAIGVDLGITSAIGLTLGLELGGKQPVESGKPSGTAFGAALSYALGARR
ncbi:MAG TPA: hypothetical protein VJW73_06485 [Gemmatimonadaceae bacterium]|nr:hypothetical protein [Gemmatimonadaceae bacterium]